MDILAYFCHKTKGYAKEKEDSRYEEDFTFFQNRVFFLQCPTIF